MPPKPSDFRVFDGRRFKLCGVFAYKRSAEIHAEDQKRKGYRVRTVKHSKASGMWFYIYRRKK